MNKISGRRRRRDIHNHKVQRQIDQRELPNVSLKIIRIL